MATLTFVNQTEVDFGAAQNIATYLRQLGITRPLICTDKGLVNLGVIDNIRAAIPNEFAVSVYDGTPENPTEAAILEAAAQYKAEGCDGVVSIGGGSSMDLGKGVALAVTHEGDLLDYTIMRGGATRIGSVAPLIAMPTTAGTGSEVSGGSVVIMDNGEKLILGSPHLVPKIAVCDPELTIGLPPHLTAATGMDALAHCIEAILSPQINPPAEAVGIDGVRRIYGDGWLKKAVADGKDKDARWNMMISATEGAMAFTKGLGLVHSLSHACGALPGLRLHHGTLNAVVMPAVLRFNKPASGDKFDRILEAMRLPASTDLADTVTQLNADLGLPANLGEMGVERDMIPGLAKHALADFCTMTNPRQPELAELEKLYDEAIG